MEKETAKKSLRPSPDALLNPRCDAIFKTLFTDNSDEVRLALKSFLEAILCVKVSDIQLRPNEMSVESETDRQTVFDITCTMDGTEAVNIEMQGLDIHRDFDKRAEYNVAHLLNHYTPKGTEWKNIPKAFQISVLNFIYDATTSDTFAVYQMQTKDNHHLSDRMAVVFIELPKLMFNVPDDIEKLTPAEKWGKFLLYADDESKQDFVGRLCNSEEGIMAANVTLAKISKDEANWLRQTALDKGQRDILSGMNEATRRGLEDGRKQGLQQGLEEGLQQGIQQGLQQGIQQGLQQGIQQGLQQGIQQGLKQGIEQGMNTVVQNALKMNLTVEQISILTGLSETEIQNLSTLK